MTLTIGSRAQSVTLAVAVGCFVGLIASCQSKQEKVESARGEVQEQREEVAEEQHDLAEAQQELNAAQQSAREEWKTDYLAFKRDMVNEVAENERLILEKRESVARLDAAAQDQYNTTLADVERRNNDLRDRLNNAMDEGDAQWTTFKDNFKREINEVEEAIKAINIP